MRRRELKSLDSSHIDPRLLFSADMYTMPRDMGRAVSDILFSSLDASLRLHLFDSQEGGKGVAKGLVIGVANLPVKAVAGAMDLLGELSACQTVSDTQPLIQSSPNSLQSYLRRVSTISS